MGKYSKGFPIVTQREISTEQLIAVSNIFIADELAEANRLKILELNYLVGITGKVPTEKDLVDKA